jgi:hypothetical protein
MPMLERARAWNRSLVFPPPRTGFFVRYTSSRETGPHPPPRCVPSQAIYFLIPRALTRCWLAVLMASLLTGQAAARVRHLLYAAVPGIQNHYPDNNYNRRYGGIGILSL